MRIDPAAAAAPAATSWGLKGLSRQAPHFPQAAAMPHSERPARSHAREQSPTLGCRWGGTVAPHRSARSTLVTRAAASIYLLVFGLGGVPTAWRSHTIDAGRAPMRQARASSLHATQYLRAGGQWQCMAVPAPLDREWEVERESSNLYSLVGRWLYSLD